jgi:two-component system cell cycle sensor histidine kinase/response regulator CckA
MSSDFDDYRTYTGRNLAQMLEIIDNITHGDFSRRPDLSNLPNDAFSQVLRGFDVMMNALVATNAEITTIKNRLEQQAAERTAEIVCANEKLSLDIIERRKAEELLAQREKFLADVFASIKDPISILDTDLNILRTNAAMEQWYAEVMPIVGHKCYWIYHHRSSPCNNCPSLLAIKSGKTEVEIIPKCDASGIRIGWIELYSFPWRDTATGTVMGIIEYIRDITDHRNAEDALAAEKDRLAVTMDSIGDAVVSTDLTGTIVMLNPVALELAGCSADQAIGKPMDEVYPFLNDSLHETHTGLIRHLIERHGLRRQTVHCILRRNNVDRSVDLTVSPIAAHNKAASGMVVVFRDTTERRNLEAELFKAKKLESLGLLAGGIAHDFNNILTGVISNIFMVKSALQPESDSHNLLVEAEKASFRAARLVQQLLTFARGGSPVKAVISIKEIIEEAVTFCLSGSTVTVRMDIPGDLPPIDADKGQIEQVMQNLVINAVQAMPNGGVLQVAAVALELVPDSVLVKAANFRLHPGAYIKITIDDDGIGVSPENIDKLFDPYFTTKPKGHGLGLTIAYSIIARHNGAIMVDSTVGKGTRFTIVLPSATTQQPSGENEQPQEQPQPGGRILVMDDEPVVRTVLIKLLGIVGYDVVCTASGQEALEVYQAAVRSGLPFKTVILDLTIPGGMGGKETVLKLLEFDPAARVIVTSGYSNDPIMADYQEHGFCGAIAKPFRVNDLHAVVARAVAKN